MPKRTAVRTREATRALPPVRTGWLHARPLLLIAFAFSVMADPVSSVAYAIEAALRELDGNLALLIPTMACVVAIVALVIISYHELVGRFPEGGGAAAATGRAFGEGWAFIPIGALIVDFVLTIGISVSAGASAIISYLPGLAPWRMEIAIGLLVLVAGLTLFGHIGRAIFALLTLAFAITAGVVLVLGFTSPEMPVGGTTAGAPLAVALAFPVAMALATGVEAPSSAIAQLGQLDDDGRRSFGRWALWLTLGIIGTLTMALTIAAVRLGVGVPQGDTTLISEIARAGGSHSAFAAFQAATALLLLSAASSSFQAGPGLLKALARHDKHASVLHGPVKHGILPGVLSRVNSHHVPLAGVGVFLLASAAVVVMAGGRDQRLVLFYAVSVFVSFLLGLVAMATLSKRDGMRGWMALNIAAVLAVAFTLIMNLTRLDALVSLAATALIAWALHWAWVRSGRPRGAAHVEGEAHVSNGASADTATAT